MTRYDGRNGTIVRVLMLMKHIEGMRRVNLRAAATYLNVHPRTIRRDLMALEEAGYSVPPWRVSGGEKTTASAAPATRATPPGLPALPASSAVPSALGSLPSGGPC